MTGARDRGPRADEPLDEADEAILRSLGAAVTGMDPVPAGLVDRILFAMTLECLQAEMMELGEVGADPVTTRGAAVATAETITFTSSTLSVMISRSQASGDLRIDGWVAPAGVFRIELVGRTERLTTVTDADGRFVFRAAPRGRASLLISSEGPGQRLLGTPVFEL